MIIMDFAKFEFTGFYTEEQEQKLKKFLIEQLKDNTDMFAGIEFINRDENSLIDTVMGIKAVMETLSEVNEDLKTAIAFAHGDIKADFDTKTVVKLFNKKPKVTEDIIS